MSFLVYLASAGDTGAPVHDRMPVHKITHHCRILEFEKSQLVKRHEDRFLAGTTLAYTLWALASNHERGKVIALDYAAAIQCLLDADGVPLCRAQYSSLETEYTSFWNGKTENFRGPLSVQGEGPQVSLLELEGKRLTVLDLRNCGFSLFSNLDPLRHCPSSGKDFLLAPRTLTGSPRPPAPLLDWVERVYEEFRTLCRDSGLGIPANTPGAQGERLYYSFKNATPIRQTRHGPALSLERDAYYGGRVACYGHGNYQGKCALWDIRSAYPWAVITHELPSTLAKYCESVTLEELVELTKTYYCVARVSYSHGGADVPQRVGLVPRYLEAGNNVPVHHPELLRLLDLNAITHVGPVAAYERGQELKRTVDRLLEIRQVQAKFKRSIREAITKSITNSWLGRLACKLAPLERVESDFLLDDDKPIPLIDPKAGTKVLYRRIGGQTYRTVPEFILSRGSLVRAGAITAIVRDYLRALCEFAGWGHILALATDSLLVDQVGHERLSALAATQTGGPGSLHLIEESDSCVVARQGVYRIGQKLAHQGIPAQALRGVGRLGVDSCSASETPLSEDSARAIIEEVELAGVISMASSLPWTWNSNRRYNSEIEDTKPLTAGLETARDPEASDQARVSELR